MIKFYKELNEAQKEQAISLISLSGEGFDLDEPLGERLRYRPNTYCTTGVSDTGEVVSVILVERYDADAWGVTSWYVHPDYRHTKTGISPLIQACKDFDGSLYCEDLAINIEYKSIITDKVVREIGNKQLKKGLTASALERFGSLL